MALFAFVLMAAFSSCIRFHGIPILPPLVREYQMKALSDQDREQLRGLRIAAILVEERIALQRQSQRTQCKRQFLDDDERTRRIAEEENTHQHQTDFTNYERAAEEHRHPEERSHTQDNFRAHFEHEHLAQNVVASSERLIEHPHQNQQPQPPPPTPQSVRGKPPAMPPPLHHHSIPVAALFTAIARGFLTRQLYRSFQVRDLRRVIQDCDMLLRDLQNNNYQLNEQDLLLQTRTLNQLRTARSQFWDIFFRYSSTEQVRLLARSREMELEHIARAPHSSASSAASSGRSLSSATQKAIERRRSLGFTKPPVTDRPVLRTVAQSSGFNHAPNQPAKAQNTRVVASTAPKSSSHQIRAKQPPVPVVHGDDASSRISRPLTISGGRPTASSSSRASSGAGSQSVPRSIHTQSFDGREEAL